MSITKLDTGQYRVNVRPQGRDVKCVRKSSQTKSEAKQYERWVVAIQHKKEWVEKPADRRPQVDFIDLWYSHHGRTLRDGDANMRKLVNIAERMASRAPTGAPAAAWHSIAPCGWQQELSPTLSTRIRPCSAACLQH